jgi:transcriptional regulator with XRE-family HTH domain
MVRNEEKYEQAVSLRKRGFTLEEIAKYCDISKSTASKWLQNNAFSTQVTKQNMRRAGAENAKRLNLINKARSGERAARYREAARSAETEYKHYRKDPLFTAGLMLFYTNGDRSDKRSIRISAVSHETHRIFIRFAIEYLGVERSKLRLWLLLSPAHDEEKCMRKWKQITGIPFTQFHKSQVIQNTTKPKNLHFGVGNTIIGSTVLKHKLDTWIEMALKELKSK